MQKDLDHDALAKAARTEVKRMQAAVARLAPGGTITMSGEQFGALAVLIHRLATERGCSDPDCFQAPVDGVRWWIPLGEVARAHTDLSKLRDENQRLSAELFRSAVYR